MTLGCHAWKTILHLSRAARKSYSHLSMSVLKAGVSPEQGRVKTSRELCARIAFLLDGSRALLLTPACLTSSCTTPTTARLRGFLNGSVWISALLCLRVGMRAPRCTDRAAETR